MVHAVPATTRCSAILREAMACSYRVAQDAIDVRAGKHGKPLVTVRVGGQVVRGNASDSGGVVAAGWMAGDGIGVDVQRVDLRAPVGRLAARFFTESEQEYLLGGDEALRFFETWAAKEAVVKYAGTGFHVGPRRFDVDLDASVDTEALPSDRRPCEVAIASPLPGFVLAIATPCPIGHIEVTYAGRNHRGALRARGRVTIFPHGPCAAPLVPDKGVGHA